MTITGLENNNYLINNKINLLINGFATDTRYLELTITNNATTHIAKVRLYPINNTFKIDIAPLVKSTFNDPAFYEIDINICSVSIQFKATFTDDTTSTSTITKNFIRGGNFQGVYPDCVTQKKNYIPDGIVDFLITEMLPVWGYNLTARYYVNKLINGSFLTIQTFNFENFDIPCKGIKVSFLNQYGTYSQWYFNNYEINDSTKHIDFIDKFSTDFNGVLFKDLGSTVESSITVKDAVPKRYNELIRHLVISPDIHIYEDGYWRKVILNNNKWVCNSRENTYKYSLTFDYYTVINPSELC